MVEVFKTNVQAPAQADEIIAMLRLHFPQTKINFDLQDCDRILRVEGQCAAEKIVHLVTANGFSCAVLE